MNFQITPAPTKLMAMGMKISDLPMLPHFNRSVSCAAISPNSVDSAGTTSSQTRLLRMDSRNLPSPMCQA